MKIDLTKIPDAEDFTPIPQGTYLCSLNNVEESVTKNGDPMWKLSFVVKDGEHTLASPGTSVPMLLRMTNNGTAGALTTSGFTIVTGDALTTTDTEKFFLYVAVLGSDEHLNVVALQ